MKQTITFQLNKLSTSLSHQTDTSDIQSDGDWGQSNLSSILNVPHVDGGIFANLFQLLSTNLLENPFFQNVLQQNTRPCVPITLQEACGIIEKRDFKSNYEQINQVNELDFLPYIEKIKRVYGEYQRVKQGQITQSVNQGLRSIQFENESIDLNKMVIFCYQTVPVFYFEEKQIKFIQFISFHFNFEILMKNRELLMNQQDQITEYLDDVEVNLFYQINSRFDQFLNVILKLNEIRENINENQQKVTQIRLILKVSKAKFLKSGIDIICKKKRIVQIENTLQILKLIQTSQKTFSNQLEFMKQQKYEQSIKLLRISQQTYNQQLRMIDALTSMPQKFQLSLQQLELALTQNIIQSYITQIQQSLTPFKALKTYLNQSFQETFTSQEDIMANSSFLNNESWYEPILPQGNLLSSLSRNEVMEHRDKHLTAKYIVQALEIVDLTSRVFRNKILDELKNQFQDFVANLVEDFQQQKGAGNSQLNYTQRSTNKRSTEAEDLEFLEEFFPTLDNCVFIRIGYFLSENLQKTLKTQLIINYNSIQSLLDAYVIEYSKTENGLKSKLIDKYLPIIEELHQISLQIYKFGQEKLSIFLSLKRLSGESSIKDFKDLVQIFVSWEKFSEVDIPPLILVQKKINEIISMNTEDLIRVDDRCKQCLQKFSQSQLVYLRSEIEKNFLSSFHKDRMRKMQKILEDEIWAPSDISFEFYEILYYLLNLKLNEDEVIQQETTLDESIINNSILLERSMRVQHSLQQLVSNPHFKIVKNELNLIREQLKFKFTSAFLTFIHFLYDYLLLFENFSELLNEHLQKMFEIIKLYNSLTTQLIVGAGAIHFGKMKTITAKNLAISSLCIRFYLQISGKLMSKFQDYKKISVTLGDDIQRINNDYRNHNQEILNKMATLLQDRFQEQSSEIQKQSWNDPQSKLTTPSKFTATILGSLRSMYIAVEDLFLSDDLRTVFSQIINSLIQDYLLNFSLINIESKLGASRLREELEYLKKALMEIGVLKDMLQDQFQQIDQVIEVIVQKSCQGYLQLKTVVEEEVKG